MEQEEVLWSSILGSTEIAHGYILAYYRIATKVIQSGSTAGELTFLRKQELILLVLAMPDFLQHSQKCCKEDCCHWNKVTSVAKLLRGPAHCSSSVNPKGTAIVGTISSKGLVGHIKDIACSNVPTRT